MMKATASVSLPRPTTSPTKHRRQGPRLKAIILITVMVTFVILAENIRLKSLGYLLNRTALAAVYNEPTTALPAPWTDGSILVDRSEDHLPSGWHDLGPDADARYELHSPEFDRYMKKIRGRTSTLFNPSMCKQVDAIMDALYTNASIAPDAEELGLPTVLSGPHSRTIWQTDKNRDAWSDQHAKWNAVNEGIGWKCELLDDEEADAWVRHHFRGTDVEWTWDYMTRPILRADFLRYLFMLVHGGFYADADTSPLNPVSEWGSIDPIVIDISRTDGPDWRANMADKPSVVVGLEVNPIAWENWATWIARPISFVQFAFGSAAYHPIFLDLVDRIVERTKSVEKRETWLEKDLAWRKTADEKQYISQIQGEMQTPPVLAWTGPVVFTDAIVSWLVARYKISWQRLRGYDRPIRIGDVLVLPHGALHARLLKDHLHGGYKPQAQMEHFLHGDKEGGWKRDGP